MPIGEVPLDEWALFKLFRTGPSGVYVLREDMVLPNANPFMFIELVDLCRDHLIQLYNPVRHPRDLVKENEVLNVYISSTKLLFATIKHSMPEATQSFFVKHRRDTNTIDCYSFLRMTCFMKQVLARMCGDHLIARAALLNQSGRTVAVNRKTPEAVIYMM